MSLKGAWHWQVALAVLLLLVAASASAAGVADRDAPSETLFLVQIIVLVAIGRLLGEFMVRIGQPSIMGQIIGGVLLGPSVFGSLWPDLQHQLFPAGEAQKSMTDAIAQLGILFLLLLAGMETDLGLAVRLRRAAFGVSLSGILIPFAAGFTLGELLPASLLPNPQARLVTALFLGTALSISSVKIVASVVREMDFMRRNIGQLIVASAIIDDTVGWVIIAVTFSLAEHGAVDLWILVRSVAGTLAFMAFSFTIGRRIVFEIIRLTHDKFKSDLPVLSAIIAIMGAMAIITDLIGVHTVLGAFVAGILVGQSPILTRQIDSQLRALTTALFMPVFFGLTGLETDLGVLSDPAILLLALGLILIASLGKFGGAFAGAKFSDFTNPEAVALGCGMNARGSTEVIVASIGLSIGVLDQRLFSVIVTMAVVTTMAMPPSLRWALARLPMREDERDRLARQGFEEQSFLSKFERILLAVDNSVSSGLATRIAGHFTALRKMPITVLNIDGKPQGPEAQSGGNRDEAGRTIDNTATAIAEQVRESAQRTVGRLGSQEAAIDGDLHVTTSGTSGDLEALLAESAEKGHDMLFVGVEPTAAPEGGLDQKISRMSKSFKGTTAICSQRGALPDDDGRLRILVPISGTQRSMRAAEFALVVAKASGAHVAAIYIREPQQASLAPRVSDIANAHLAAFRKIDEIASYNDISVEKITQSSGAPDLSILRQARRGRFNLIVLGVSRRAGEMLSYGPIADTLLEAADRSFILVETE
ncbi:potassium transporter [Rhizobium esperanzae]|uniref:Potassium transporter n=1 Tax=Rhizobium esperanzae TaxID=1967781 RepID=A0A246DX32_9HYPH|nr:cation:proton antiporter [Rhizobium esperanzae]OWO94900.1 potassium transporter [Rhizobium esperanzae]